MVYKTQLWEHISLETKQFKTLYVHLQIKYFKGVVDYDFTFLTLVSV